MIGFGIMIALILGVSSLAVLDLGAGNVRMTMLYQADMQGALIADHLVFSQTTVAKKSRDAIVHISDPAVVHEDEQGMLAAIADMHTDLDQGSKYFYSVEGKATIAGIIADLPAWEQMYRDMIPYLEARDVRGATIALDKTIRDGKQLTDLLARATAVKQKRAKEKFSANLEEYQHARVLLISAAGLSIALGALLSIVIARGFSVPLGKAVTVLEGMAGGDLTVTLDVDTQDEVGRMAQTLNTSLGKLRSTLQNVSATANSAGAASQQLSAAAEALASGAQEQAASLEETSASLEQIAATVRQSADNAKQANRIAATSRESAERGQDVVSSAVGAMAEINSASARISDIISTIDEIAFQTNLLAVNAAVEAARAGEQGRGFAVVATEVRSLALRSAGAAKEIKSLIQDSLRKVERGSELVNRSGETLTSIVGSVKKVTDIVSEISAAGDEQSTGVDQVTTAVTQIDQVTQQNAAQTEELSSTARSLAQQSTHLLKLVGLFKLGAVGEDTLLGPAASRAAVKLPSHSLRALGGTKKPGTLYKPSTKTSKQLPAALLEASDIAAEAAFESF